MKILSLLLCDFFTHLMERLLEAPEEHLQTGLDQVLRSAHSEASCSGSGADSRSEVLTLDVYMKVYTK